MPAPRSREHLANSAVPGEDLALSFAHGGWLPVAADLTHFTVRRRHYLYSGGKPAPRLNPSRGYRIVPIDSELLAHRAVPAHLQSWIDGSWGGEDDFLARGFGSAALHSDTTASGSLADCVLDGRAEIGIHTAPEHRRRGVATQVAAPTVAIAIDHGSAQVGWHCNEDNPGSCRTAEAVGFTLERKYQMFAYRREGLNTRR